MIIGKKLKPKAKEKGFTESIKKYAWTPTFMTSGDLVWLESYIETRTWDELGYWYNDRGKFKTKSYFWGWNIIERKRNMEY